MKDLWKELVLKLHKIFINNKVEILVLNYCTSIHKD